MAGAKGRSGGQRSGAGRKASEARLLGLIGGRAKVQQEEVLASPVACPEDFTPEQEAVWAELAEHAIKARTLVPGTVSAFSRLCKAVVRHAKMESQIERDGFTYLKVMVDSSGQEHTEVKAHPLISRAASAETMIRGGLKDFAICPFGKALVEAVAKPVDRFAKFRKTAG